MKEKRRRLQDCPLLLWKNQITGAETEKRRERPVVCGRVINVGLEMVATDVGAKEERRVPLREFVADSGVPSVSVGGIIGVYVESNPDDGPILLSMGKARKKGGWEKIGKSWGSENRRLWLWSHLIPPKKPWRKKMARPVVDQDLCSGCGTCVEICPEVFEIQDDKAKVVGPDKCGTCKCQEAADSCPVEAITMA